jgi:hypothetical protein
VKRCRGRPRRCCDCIDLHAIPNDQRSFLATQNGLLDDVKLDDVKVAAAALQSFAGPSRRQEPFTSNPGASTVRRQPFVVFRSRRNRTR